MSMGLPRFPRNLADIGPIIASYCDAMSFFPGTNLLSLRPQCSFGSTAVCLAVIFLAVSGCVIDTVPQPEDISEDAVFYAPSAEDFLIVGLDGAASAPGIIHLTNLDKGAEASLSTTAMGGFVGSVRADAGDRVEINLEREGLVVASLSLLLEGSTVQAEAAADALDESFMDPAMTGMGLGPTSELTVLSLDEVEISGQPGSVMPGLFMAVANIDTGATALGQVAADGSYGVTVAARSGDSLRVFVVEPSAGQGGGEAIVLVVP